MKIFQEKAWLYPAILYSILYSEMWVAMNVWKLKLNCWKNVHKRVRLILNYHFLYAIRWSCFVTVFFCNVANTQASTSVSVFCHFSLFRSQKRKREKRNGKKNERWKFEKTKNCNKGNEDRANLCFSNGVLALHAIPKCCNSKYNTA